MQNLILRLIILQTALLFLSSITTSCSSAIYQRGSYLQSYHCGGLQNAENQINAIARKNIPAKEYTKSPNATWVLLDLATTRFAQGKIDAAINDYQLAIEALDYYDQDITAEQLTKILLQDNTTAYQSADFEHVLAHVYFALALLHKGDHDNAFAMLRKAEEFQQKKRNIYIKTPLTNGYHVIDNPVSKYLFATLLEKNGDRSNAAILYRQSEELINSNNKSLYPPFSVSEKKATVLVVCHNGNVPYKVTGTCNASIASALALEILLSGRHRDPAISTLTGIPVPYLRNWPHSYPLPTSVRIDCFQPQSLHPFFDIGYAAAKELNQKLPIIAARGVARLLLRRAAVGYCQDQDPTIGFLADMAMLIANTQTRADTRSWSTLPLTIDLARFDLDPGLHNLTLQIDSRPYDLKECSYQIQLKPNDLCIINVFNIHPGNTRILIPDRFLPY